MKPLPDLDDTAAMVKRGRASVLFAARKEAIEMLRDAHTAMQIGALFGIEMEANARVARNAADRLLTLCAMSNELDSPTTTTAAELAPTF